MSDEHEFNPNDPAHCDACFKEGEARLSANRAHQLDATKLIDREGWNCAKCGHRHAGRTLANICIGCPCPETTPLDTAEDDWIRIASQNAKDATDRLKLLQNLYEKALDQRDSALAELTDTRRFWKAAKDALQAEKVVSQEHFDYYLSESGRCEVARSALARIGHGMDLRYAEPKGMAEIAREALERTTRTDKKPNHMERLARLVEEFRNAGELDKLRHGLGFGPPLGVSPLKALMDRECESLRPQVDDAHKRETES